MKTAKRLLALALAGVMALALLTGCSDSSSKAKQVEEYFRYMNGGYTNYQKDETLDKKLEVIAIIKKELGDYLATGSVTPWVGEVEPGQSALAQAESMKCYMRIQFGNYDSSGTALHAIAFTMTDKKSDGHRYYLALETFATIKTPRT